MTDTYFPVSDAVELAEFSSTPAAPAASTVLLYAKNDDNLYQQSPGGVETKLVGTSGSAGGDLSGTYPNPTLAADRITKATGTAKGDLIGFTASATPTNIAVGSDGLTAMADSGASPGLSYGVPYRPINTQAADYTLVLADKDQFVKVTKATAQVLTVPPNSSVAFAIGVEILGVQYAAGQVTITAGAGVTINATPGLKTAAQYGTFALKKIGTDEWLAFGRLSA